MKITRGRCDVYSRPMHGPHIFVWCLSIVFLIAWATPSFGQATTRVSVNSNGLQSDDDSERASVSDNGRYVAFESSATNLVANDTNGVDDVFVHDRMTNSTVRISVSSTGQAGDAKSGRPAISNDGRYVAFFSDASNFSDGDTTVFDSMLCPACTGQRDVFVHDRDPDMNGIFDEGNGVTTRVSVSSSGVSGNGSSTRPAISGDGQVVAYRSAATNLVAADTNGVIDVFVHNLQTSTTVRASVGPAGLEADAKSDRPAVSNDGKFVVFFSDATNFVADDTNALRDVYVFNIASQTTVLVSVGASGALSNGASSRPSLSGNGRFVAFRSDASNLVNGDTNMFEDIFVRDRDPDNNGLFDEGNGVTKLASSGQGSSADGDSSTPVISTDGQFVAFQSDATNLVSGDQNLSRDVFVYDRQANSMERVSVCGSGTEGGGNSERPSVSGDGRFVAYHSKASNLVMDDSNAMTDIFVRDRSLSGDDSGCVATPTDPTPIPPTAATPSPCGAMGMIPVVMMFTALCSLRKRRQLRK